MSRGFLSYHPGEDWNGDKGGNSDLGAPVYSIGNGYVTFAQDVSAELGNVVIVRHAYLEEGKMLFADSMYAHLNIILVRKGQQVSRGQQVGTIGTNHGMYEAHLYYEIRKNLFIGIKHSDFANDFSNYFRPAQFIAQHRRLSGADQIASIPINTYKIDQSGIQVTADAKSIAGVEPATLKTKPAANSKVHR